ncbi:filamentous haemagglutinin family protein [Hyphomicrobium sp. 2TAF46]|uniref:filamentous haemagglutinin family protein n=1 Tax=Hyphomicrobium sp. 2TAF46 TaxID=3233019 RepID=UPI003F91580A
MTVTVSTSSVSSANRNARRAALLTSVSVLALFMASPGAAANPLASGNNLPTPSAAAIAAAQSGQQEAARAARAAQNSLTRATLAIQAMQATQQAARDAARAGLNAIPGGIPNGLGVGGLQIGAGVKLPDGSVNGQLWQGAKLPTQFTDGDRTKVGIEQTQAKAILTWDTFHVGAGTDLTFDQKGNSNWVALNRVLGTDAKPSQILGNIKADGSIYVINQNGIVFGGASQVNVGALIASTAKISNEQFLNSGIYSTQSGTSYVPSFTDASGLVKVEAGALITTNAPTSVTSGGGFVLLMGSSVENAGSITTPLGQTQLAAGDDFILRRGVGTEANAFSTTRGNEIAPIIRAGSLAGSVTNNGLIFSQQGDITLAGRTITQNGILVSTTSVNARGTIHLLNSATDALGSVTLGADSVSTIIPELDSAATALNSQRDALIAESATQNIARLNANFGAFDNLSKLADRMDQSRIEIVTGGNTVFRSGSLTIAQGGQVAVSAGNRVFTEGGATIDVSGVRDVLLPMSANNLKVNIQGNELRDSPLNRDQNYLKNADAWIDIRDLIFVPKGTGGYDSDRYYTPGGLLEVGGYLANTAHKIGEWSALGGTITLSAPEVIAQQGSIFDISGGSVRYAGGNIQTTNFLGKDGRLYNVNDARADMTFYGLGEGFVRSNSRWGVTQVWSSPFGKGRVSTRWEDGYTVGRDAGKLILSTPTSIFEGKILADVVTGDRQINARPVGTTDGYKLAQTQAALNGQLLLGRYTALGLSNAYTTDVKFGDIASITENLDAAAVLPAERANTAWLDSGLINDARLGGLNIATQGSIIVDAPMTLADGGQVKLVASTVDIKGDITVRSGSVTVTNILKPDTPSASPIVLTAGGQSQLALHGGATIDVRGLWSNALTDPANLSGLAYLNGGDVVFDSTQNVTIASGSNIDVSSGAAVLVNGKTKGGKGGNVTLIAADASAGAASTSGTLVLDGDIKAYGVNGGGKLKVGTAAVLITSANVAPVADQLVLSPDWFRKGFAQYDINGYDRLTVADGTRLDVEMPVYRFTNGSFAAHGRDPSAALELWTPPLFLDDPGNRKLIQRAGADVVLQSNRANAGGAIVIGTGAAINADPGSSITLQSPGQINVDGTLRASGGAINIFQINSASTASGSANPVPGQKSILIDDHALLDVTGSATTSVDVRGLRYGIIRDGGSITIGAETKRDNGAGIAQAADAFVVVKSGAVLDASGASGVIDLPDAAGGFTTVAVASNGGSIALNSFNGLYLDGTMRAASGGAGASGGTLFLTLETARYKDALSVPDDVRFIRELVIGQNDEPSISGAPFQIGTARISADQIERGGFDSFSAYADVIRFDGNVDLSLARSIELYHSVLTGDGSGMSVRLAAPLVQFKPAANVSLSGNPVYPKAIGLPSQRPTSATLVVNADLIDGYAMQARGVAGSLPLLDGNRAFDYAGFDQVTLNSRGDIRVVGALVGGRILELNAAQIYPVTNADASIGATDLVRLGRSTAQTPDLPYSAFGKLTVSGKVIEQGGVLRAPLGKITLGAATSFNALSPPITETVTLLPGSITSASGSGLELPYGGTVDGITYLYAGAAVTAPFENFGSILSGVVLAGKSFTVAEGALLDLSGGGNLRGAGFISGRGGSVDVLTTPLVNANPAMTYSAKNNQVYAILPGVQMAYAPIGADAGASPSIGRQVTIPNGIPGLPAGTYTLLPARYALMPGAYRVELGANASVASGAQQIAPGTWGIQGYQGTANTGARDALPTQMIVTAGQSVRTYSQYNETGYAEYLLGEAARLGSPRPTLPVDGKTFYLSYAAQPSVTAPALTFDGKAVFDPGKGGYGGTLRVDSLYYPQINLEVTAAGTQGTAGYISIEDKDLNAIGATRMSIGSFQNYVKDLGYVSAGSYINGLVLREGVSLRAPEIILGAGRGGITIEDGVTLSTIGQTGVTPMSADGGFSYRIYDSSNSILAISNSLLNFVGTEQPSGSNPGISIGKAQLYTEGTLAFVTSSGSKLALDRDLRFGAKYLSFAVPSINIGENTAIDAAAAAHVLPDGLILNQQVLTRLLQGNQGVGVPKVETLILSAGQSINFFGNASLNTIDPSTGKSSLAELVLNTPAIYGLGAAGDSATITTGTLIWNGVSDGVQRGGSRQPGSLPPPAVIPGGPGTGSGTLDIVADEIVLGYRKFLQPDTQLTLDRLALGFSSVNLTASTRITANNRNTLSVYSSGTDAASYVGGTLNLITPLLTGDAASVTRFISGGALNLSAPGGATATTTDVLGAEIGLKGQTVTVASTIALPSGKLSIEADGDILLTDSARLDLAGREVTMVDVKKYSWGGDVVLNSAHGNIAQSAQSVIDLSARYNRGGTLSATAIDASAGNVTLAGKILGTATGVFNASGTLVPYLGASIDLRAQTIADFSALNARLSDGGVFGGRSFQFKKEGFNLVIGDELKANNINVSVDGGSLTVNGRIDASGAQVGSIRLSARDELTLGSSAVLDAHGTQLRVDSYGQPIDAPNRAVVELTTTNNATGAAGWMRIASGATIDVRSADSNARGTVTLNAPRLTETGGDIAIDATGPVTVRGAKSIAVNGFWTYSPTDADGTIVQDNGGTNPLGADGSIGLNQIDQRNIIFMNAAAGNTGLQNRLAGLSSYGSAFHLRPGVEINSKDTPNGNLTVKGDLDLSGFRYGPNANSAIRGSGEVGMLVIRASNNLTVKGSINDGFAPPPATPDDNGWMISTFIRPGEPLPSDISGGNGLVFEIEYQMPDDGSFVITTDGSWYDSSTGPVPAGSAVEFMSLTAGSPSPFTVSSTEPRPEPGKVWAVAPMLAAGSQSWSMRLASGADIAAVNSRALQSSKTGDLVLDDEHFSGPSKKQLAASVIRTGTGDLDLLAGGNFNMKTLFGVYTAGTQSPNVSPAFNQPRGTESRDSGGGGSVLGARGSDYESLVAGPSSVYQAWYPEQGGNLLVKAQGDITGFNTASSGSQLPSTNVGNWLWRQGGNLSGLPTAWWINFGTYVLPLTSSGATQYQGIEPQLAAFTGFGALGGGNIAIDAGRNAGVITGIGTFQDKLSQGLTVAVGGTGRLIDGRLVQTGGGDLSIKVGGALNPLDAGINPSRSDGGISLFGGNDTLRADLNGVVTNLRGALNIDAGSIGRIDLGYGKNRYEFKVDPRPIDLTIPNAARSNGGPLLVVGDAAAMFTSRGDLVLSAVNDPGRTPQQNATPYSVSVNGVTSSYTGGGYSWFSLWTGNTAIDLFAAGGNLAPTTIGVNGPTTITSTAPALRTSGDYPSILRAVAAEGNVYYGAQLYDPNNAYTTSLVLAPSPRGQLEILAQGSIFTLGMPIDMSGADMSVLPTPFNPAFYGGATMRDPLFDNTSQAGAGKFFPLSLFAFGPNTVVGDLHAGDTEPQRFYAVTGDIVGLRTGEILDFTIGGSIASPKPVNTWYVAAKPVRIIAGRDIVGAGQQPRDYINGRPQYVEGNYGAQSSGNIIYHANESDVSVISAGRDILYANFQVAGPGTLEVSAGRNLYQGDKGAITSIGPIAIGDSRLGAGLAVQAGIGVTAPDYARLAALYLDPKNLAAAGTPLADQPGKVAKTYEQDLVTWLKDRYGFAGTQDEAKAYFDALAPEQQRVFLRQVYFAELRAGGREYNDQTSSRYGSYLRGRSVIAALFPDQDANGKPIQRSGDITIFGGSGLRTLFGGGIQVLTPGGRSVIGVEGQVPPASAGVITQGSGDIELYSKGSILLGLSRIMTTYGGSILAWSADGDINAGRGAKTTVLYTPPKRVYDNYGNVTLSPQVPASGAGIASLNPVAGVLPGDIDLIAPLGTIDAGEAGVRSSGNVNLAALHIVNAANIQAQGNTTGVPQIQAPNIGGLMEASDASGAAAKQATNPAQSGASEQPSVIIVEVIGFGGGESDDEKEKRKPQRQSNLNYDPNSTLRVLGNGEITSEQTKALTDEEKRLLSEGERRRL